MGSLSLVPLIAFAPLMLRQGCPSIMGGFPGDSEQASHVGCERLAVHGE